MDSELAANKPGAWTSQTFPAIGGVGEHDRLEFIDRTPRKWVWRTEIVQQAFKAHTGPKRLVRYEDLRADTHLRGIFDWLDLEIDDTQLHTIVERHAFERIPEKAKGPEAFFRAATPGLWRQNMSAEEQATMLEILGPKVDELGYET